MNYQEQAEQEMWDAASRELPAPHPLAYDVFVYDTGARCLSTDSLKDATARADQVKGYVLNRFEQRVYDAQPLAEPIPWLNQDGDTFEIKDRE